MSDIGYCLSFPTPQLTSLTLISLRYDYQRAIDNHFSHLPFLPSAPALRKIIIKDCHLPALPHTLNLTDIRFLGELERPIRYVISGPNSFQQAKGIQLLDFSAKGGSQYDFPKHLIHLRSLQLKLKEPQAMVELPNLVELDIDFCLPRYIVDLLRYLGIPFSGLKVLTITNEGDEPYIIGSIYEVYRDLLRACSNVESLVIEETCLAFILKIIRDECLAANLSKRYTSPHHLGEDINKFMGNYYGELKDSGPDAIEQPALTICPFYFTDLPEDAPSQTLDSSESSTE